MDTWMVGYMDEEEGFLDEQVAKAVPMRNGIISPTQNHTQLWVEGNVFDF